MRKQKQVRYCGNSKCSNRVTRIGSGGKKLYRCQGECGILRKKETACRLEDR